MDLGMLGEWEIACGRLVACPAANRARKERRAYAMAISVFVAISSLSPAGEVQQTGNRQNEE